jgi:hypothetical protein
LSSIRAASKRRVGEKRQSLFFVKNSIVKTEVWGDAMSWCNGQFRGRSSFAESTAWPARTNYFWTILLKSKKSDEGDLGISLHLSRLLCLGEFELSVYVSCFPDRTLV